MKKLIFLLSILFLSKNSEVLPAHKKSIFFKKLSAFVDEFDQKYNDFVKGKSNDTPEQFFYVFLNYFDKFNYFSLYSNDSQDFDFQKAASTYFDNIRVSFEKEYPNLLVQKLSFRDFLYNFLDALDFLYSSFKLKQINYSMFLEKKLRCNIYFHHLQSKIKTDKDRKLFEGSKIYLETLKKDLEEFYKKSSCSEELVGFWESFINLVKKPIKENDFLNIVSAKDKEFDGFKKLIKSPDQIRFFFNIKKFISLIISVFKKSNYSVFLSNEISKDFGLIINISENFIRDYKTMNNDTIIAIASFLEDQLKNIENKLSNIVEIESYCIILSNIGVICHEKLNINKIIK